MQSGHHRPDASLLIFFYVFYETTDLFFVFFDTLFISFLILFVLLLLSETTLNRQLHDIK